MNADIVASLLSGVGGIILGFFLSLVATWWQEGRKKREQKESVCTLLRLEISQNLARLEDFWQNRVLQLPDDGSYEPEEIEFLRRVNFIHELAPEWLHVMWESQASNAPMALTKVQLQQVFDHHTNLARFTKLRALLAEVLQPSFALARYKAHLNVPPDKRQKLVRDWQIELGQPTNIIHLGVLEDFNKSTLALWGECETIYVEQHTRGNPLPAPAIAKPNLLTRLKGRLPSKRQQKQP